MIGWILLGLALVYELYALVTGRAETISAAFWRWYSKRPEWLRAVIFWAFVTLFGWLVLHLFAPGIVKGTGIF